MAWEPILALENNLELDTDFTFENGQRSQALWLEKMFRIDMPNKVIGADINLREYAISRLPPSHVELSDIRDQLRKLPLLEDLTLNNIVIRADDELISVLNEYPQLKELCITGFYLELPDGGWERLNLPRIQKIRLHSSNPLPDVAMVRLSQFQTLKYLDLDQGVEHEWSDAAATAIGALQNLETLYLTPNKLTTKQWQAIQNIASLKSISLSAFPRINHKISDSDFEHIPAWPNLEELDLSDSKITDEGLKHIRLFPKLKKLSLAFSDISDRGMKVLSQLPELESLNLHRTSITDIGVEELTKANHLQVLHLSQTFVINACLEDVAKMKSLRIVTLSNTKVSVEGITKLKTLRPDLEIN